MLPAERACYLDLMIYQHQNGTIPDDPPRLLMYCSGIDQATLEAVLQAKFRRCDKGWYNERLSREIEKRKSYSRSQSLNGSVGQFWKKVKAELKSEKKWLQVRKKLSHLSKDQLFDLINQFHSLDFTSFSAMLQAMLEHIENRNENGNEIENEVEKRNREIPEGVSGEDLWRSDFAVYRAGLIEAYNRLVNDPAFLSAQKRLNPGVDIRLTLEKSCVNFWATEEGWEHKRKSKVRTIDWKTTLAKTISQPMNKVYEPRTNSFSEQAAAKRTGLNDLRREAAGHLFRASGQDHP